MEIRAEQIQPGDKVSAGKIAYVMRDDRARQITGYSRRERIVIRADYDQTVQVAR